jgi:integrase
MLLSRIRGTPRLTASLLYGSGFRVLECVRLRVKDVDFTRRELLVRDGKGRKDRVTVLPEHLVGELERHLQRVRLQHEADLRGGTGFMELPDVLRRKYPNALREWATPRQSTRPKSERTMPRYSRIELWKSRRRIRESTTGDWLEPASVSRLRLRGRLGVITE